VYTYPIKENIFKLGVFWVQCGNHHGLAGVFDRNTLSLLNIKGLGGKSWRVRIRVRVRGIRIRGQGLEDLVCVLYMN
jgi:hypothetical protein